MKSLFAKVSAVLTAVVLSTSVLAQQESTAVDLDQLLDTLKKGQIQQSKENKAREQEFMSKSAEQGRILTNTIAERDAALKLSESLETQFENNEFKLADLSEALNKRLGSLKELFGVLQQVSGDTKAKFQTSIVSAEIPGRDKFLEDLSVQMGKSSKLTSIDEIEKVWFEMQREMTEQGKVKRFTTDVIVAGGDKVSKEVVRVGSFNLIADGKYLEFNPNTGNVAELTRQPSGRFLDSAVKVQNNPGQINGFALDPTGGSILGLLVQAATLSEKVEQGGTVGYIILAVGALGLLLALERAISLQISSMKVNAQLKSATVSDKNPLGRVMKVKQDYPTADTETLELKLSEAILGEVPKLGRNLTFIKIISVVAPLMGLLGTVTGMINTFQAITLFGTGDPKLMAGGISQALVTTVLGLVVAIPMTLLYALLSSKHKNIIYILQEQASGIIAERSELAAEGSEKGT